MATPLVNANPPKFKAYSKQATYLHYAAPLTLFLSLGIAIGTPDFALRAFLYIVAAAFATLWGRSWLGIITILLVVALETLQYVYIHGARASGAHYAALIFTLFTIVMILRALLQEKSDQMVTPTEYENHLRMVIESAGIGLWDWNPASGRVAWYGADEKMHGIPAGSFDGRFETVLALIHPDDRDYFQKMQTEAIQAKQQEMRATYRIIRPDKKIRWITGVGKYYYDRKGVVIRGMGIGLDVTDLVEARQKMEVLVAEKEALLSELMHRVKNNMQMITSLINLQARRIEDEDIKRHLSDLMGRIRAIALVQEQLTYRGELAKIDLLGYLQDLGRAVVSLHRDNVTFVIRGDRVEVPLSRAIPVCLIVNELLSNSLKYAFADGRKGTISVEVKRLSSEQACVWVKDDGPGLENAGGGSVSAVKECGLGMSLINALSGQARATLEIVDAPGAVFRLSFPVKIDEKR